jgi:dsRNA-specific ribonuclease
MNMDDDIRIEKKTNGNEVYIFDPYNPLNKLITNEAIEGILKKYGVEYKVQNYELWKRSFINKSYIRRPHIENEHNNITIAPKPDDCIPLFKKSNERLEFVGDGVLECICKFELYRRFPKENEGFMTEKKIALVKNEAIGRIAYEMGLHEWLILSKHAESKQTRTNLKKLGCLFEAFLGALFLDFNKIQVNDDDGWFSDVFSTGPGFQIAQVFIENVFEQHVDWISLIKNDDNYKNILQVIIQKEFKITPEYLELDSYNSDYGYRMGVYICLGQPIHMVSHSQSIDISTFASFNEIHNYMSINGKILIFLGEGIHKIKKKAEQIASEETIIKLKPFVKG